MYSGDDDTTALLHRYDFEWLLEAVVKVVFTDRAGQTLFYLSIHALLNGPY